MIAGRPLAAEHDGSNNEVHQELGMVDCFVGDEGDKDAESDREGGEAFS
ncbi:MAG: hypothetical protein IPM39_29390 [Chloroflexi bacterium]|nr:hypothetical protein [Chloroflexota bacterium]